MSIAELLLPELDAEIRTTQATLERVPERPADFAPHPKSMPLNKLAPHVAHMAEFGLAVLTRPGVDLAASGLKPPAFGPPAQLLATFNGDVAQLRKTLAAMPDAAWTEPWKLSHGSHGIFEGPRFLAYRVMFLNHLVHHRAQLGVYLRLNGVPVPSSYGPSADEPR